LLLLAVGPQVSNKNLQERAVIVYALVGAIVLLVAVTMFSSLDTSGRRRQ
jgi:multisubunit Na+/H+ antiporter MnhB subunit